MTENVEAVKGTIFDIQRFSVHDGQGIRTNVFLKGCPIRCEWCSNPESQIVLPQLLFDQKLCLNCGECVKHCEYHVLSSTDMRLSQINCEACMNCVCKPCVTACYARALTVIGREVTVSEVMDEVEKDRGFYEVSGGGITLTGGEPLMQPVFSHALLKESKARGIGTAVETCCNVKWETICNLFGLVDLFLCDLKHVDSKKLYDFTRADCSLILSNISKLAKTVANIIIRVPVITGFNDTEDVISQIGLFALGCGVEKIELLPYHVMGLPKYHKLGMRSIPEKKAIPDEEKMHEMEQILKNMGLSVGSI